MSLLNCQSSAFKLLNNQAFKMFDKPARDGMCVMSTKNENLAARSVEKITLPEFHINQVEELVSELKENLRLSAMTTKTRCFVSRKSSRASPYRIPARCNGTCDKNSLCQDCEMRNRRILRNGHQHEDDPYELLQKLIQEGNLVTEAVRRINLSRELPPKQRYFYDSEDEFDTSSFARRHNVSQDSSE